MYLVLKYENDREVAVDSDGSTHANEHGELYSTAAEAEAVAKKYGGSVHDEVRVFGDDLDDEDC